MKKTNLLFLLVIILLPISLSAQNKKESKTPKPNLNLDRINDSTLWPEGWVKWGMQGGRADSDSCYYSIIDAHAKYRGKNSLLISSIGKPGGNFGSAVCRIPAAAYEAKTIELKGMMKYESAGWVGLMLRIDGKHDISLAFDNMQQSNITGNSDWKEFSIKLKYPKMAETVYAGGIIFGEGKLWVSDLRLYMDGKEISKINTGNAPEAIRDTLFDNGSGIDSVALSACDKESLKKLCMVWGLMKYHHPAIAKGEYNWDFELFRMLPGYMAALDDRQRDSLLCGWIESYGKFPTRNVRYPDDAKLIPDFDWITSSGLSPELSSLLTDVKNARRSKKGYYSRPAQFPVKLPLSIMVRIGIPLPELGEQVYTSDCPDAGFRLLSLFRYWNIVQYYHPYRYLIGEDWKNIPDRYIPEFINANGMLEYQLAVSALVAEINDGHAQVNPGWKGRKEINRYVGERSALPWVRFIGDEAVVGGYCRLKDSLDMIAGLQRGDVVTSIGGKSVEEIVGERLRYISGSYRPYKLSLLSDDMLRTNDSTLLVEYLRDGQTSETVLKTYPLRQLDRATKYSRPDTSLVFPVPGIALINPAKLKSKEIKPMMEHLWNTKGFIIDLRQYPMGLGKIGDYLIKGKKKFAILTKPDMKTPGLFVRMGYPFGRMKMGSHKRQYDGKVVILVNEHTISSGEFHAMAFRMSPNAVVIGSTTAGADGNVIPDFYLPGGISTSFTGLGVYHPDGRETQRVGIIPDIEVKPTVEGIRQGRDELVEKAIEIIGKQ